MHLAFALSPVANLAAAVGNAPASFSTGAYTAMLSMRTKAFEDLAEEYGVPRERRHLLAGPVGTAVAELATERGADVIVVGATHRNRLDRFVMGSTAEQIADRAPCSVMIVPPGDSASLPKM